MAVRVFYYSGTAASLAYLASKLNFTLRNPNLYPRADESLSGNPSLYPRADESLSGHQSRRIIDLRALASSLVRSLSLLNL